ncbi:hypothetical protein AB0I28_02120 [Phytomonospora sp. NPDC050363]|uniref:hypothetical protein n=1 Tax=Phytomonospora sp. NPDC050363 TaxID=3155642 RepID=UPI0033DAAB7B
MTVTVQEPSRHALRLSPSEAGGGLLEGAEGDGDPEAEGAAPASTVARDGVQAVRAVRASKTTAYRFMLFSPSMRLS